MVHTSSPAISPSNDDQYFNEQIGLEDWVRKQQQLGVVGTLPTLQMDRIPEQQPAQRNVSQISPFHAIELLHLFVSHKVIFNCCNTLEQLPVKYRTKQCSMAPSNLRTTGQTRLPHLQDHLYTDVHVTKCLELNPGIKHFYLPYILSYSPISY